MFKKYFVPVACGAVVLLVSACSKKGITPDPTPVVPVTPVSTVPVDKNWTFESTPFFSDEFSYTGTPDTTKWGYDLGGGGWGNSELEYYTDSLRNVHVANGMLYITAINEPFHNMFYTSSRMVSKNDGNLLYGRIEASAKLPPGRGTWPAIWMLPTNWVYGDWPKSGEIDIMEQVGFDPLNVHFSVHNSVNNGGNSHTSTMNIPTDTSAFHKYRVDWTPYAIRGYYDDSMVFSFVNPGDGFTEWPFDQKFHVLLNLAIGGTWGGTDGVDNSIFPTTMVVDYIRFYKMVPQ